MKLEIRRAAASDIAPLIEVLEDTYRGTWRPHIRPEVAERYEREDKIGHYVRTDFQGFWVAMHEGRLVGMVHWSGDFVHALHVRREHQGHGVGRALLALAENEMKAVGVSAARLETDTFNERSRAFYQHMGYVEMARYPDTEWDSGFTTVLFEKRLAR